ncbi:MAG TPA: hypothetical protein EYM97_08225 [Gemmatimonadetes bacterium]|nr:hypothetical protein [Gemmatimonadota bacterium]
MSDTSEGNPARFLARSVLLRAVRDLGREEDWVALDVFVSSVTFNSICKQAGWDPGWVREIFDAIFGLIDEPIEVKRSVISQTASLLKEECKI